MDTRLTYLLTLLPPLPPLGEAPLLALSEVLGLMRQQGGADLESLARLLEAQSPLQRGLDEWVVNQPGSRAAPSTLPPSLRALFDEERVAGLTEADWVSSVRQADLDLIRETGRRLGSKLLVRWSDWERALRLHLARRRALLRGDRDEPGPPPPHELDPGLEATLAAWSAARSRGADGGRLGAAMAAEIALDRARLAFLEGESPRYSFALDELAAYLLQLSLLERHRRLDPQRGRALLEEVAAL